MSDSSHIEKPVCVSLIVCEGVIVNAQTNNKTFVEAFTELYAQSIPVRATRLCLAASLTNVVGKAKLIVKVTAPSQREVFKADGEITGSNPLQAHDLVFNLMGFELSEWGTYHLDVFAGAEHLVGRPFTLQQVGAPTT